MPLRLAAADQRSRIHQRVQPCSIKSCETTSKLH
jgi:hypothetical protein